MTAARITNGKVRPGTAITKVRAISISGARVPAPVSSRRARNQATTTRPSAATNAGNKPPVNSATIEMLVTEPIVISTRLGGIVSDIALEVASSEASSPRMGTATPHLREEDWCHRGHISGFRSGNSRNQIHCAEQHVG